MNRGFKIYFKEGKKASASTLKNKGNYIRFYTFLMVKLLSLVFIPLYSLARLAQVRLTKSVKDDNEIEFTKSLKSSDSFKNFWTIYLADGFKLLYILGNILVITLATGILYAVGFGLEQFIISQMRNFNVMISVLFAIPGALVLVIYLLTLPFKYVPNAHIVDSSSEDVGASKVLYYSFNALKKTGKKTLFVSYLLELLFNLLYFVVVLVVYLILNEIFILELTVFVVILLALPYFYVFPKIALTFSVARYCLYEDVVYDQLIANKKVSGIAIKDVTTKNVATPKQMLNHIFSNEDSEETEIAKMSALLNMKNLYKVEEKTPEQIKKETEEKILATPIDEFDLTIEKSVEEVVEELPVFEEAAEEVVEELPVFEEAVEEVVEELPVFEEAIEEVVEELPVFEEAAEEVVEELSVYEEATEEVVEELSVYEEAAEEVVEELPVFEEATEEVVEELPVFEETVEEVVEELPVFEEATEEVVEETEVSEELELFDIENEVE